MALSTAQSPSSEDRKSLFLRACRSEPVERMPVWMMRQAGRYLSEYRAVREKHSFLKVCKTPDLAVEVSLQPLRIVGVDAAIIFSDILIPAEAMGLPLEIGDGGPVLHQPVRDEAAVNALKDFDPLKETGFLMAAISSLCRQVGPQVPVIGFAAAPWTLACYLVDGEAKSGFAETKRFLLSNPALFRKLLGKIAANTARYLRAQMDAGAAAVQLFDTWCGELSRRDYLEFALPATQQVIDELKPGGVPVILYTKASAHLLEAAARSGATVLSVDWRMDLDDVRRRVGSRIALQGNVDPCVLLGPKEGITAAVTRAVEQTRGAGHILNLGHGILPDTPVENARLFVRSGQTQSFAEQIPAAR